MKKGYKKNEGIDIGNKEMSKVICFPYHDIGYYDNVYIKKEGK